MWRAVSSIWWRKPLAYVRSDQPTLHVTVDGKGREFVFETGAHHYCKPRDGTHRCRRANETRQWRGYMDPTPRP